MGARATKLENKNEQGNQLDGSSRRRLKITKKRRSWPGKVTDQLTIRGKEEPKMRKNTLHDLHMDPPPAFRKFESEVDWQNMDHDIALQLWEDVFKPLYTFYEVRRVTSPSVDTSDL